jgi:hypothetical protein
MTGFANALRMHSDERCVSTQPNELCEVVECDRCTAKYCVCDTTGSIRTVKVALRRRLDQDHGRFVHTPAYPTGDGLVPAFRSMIR